MVDISAATRARRTAPTKPHLYYGHGKWWCKGPDLYIGSGPTPEAAHRAMRTSVWASFEWQMREARPPC